MIDFIYSDFWKWYYDNQDKQEYFAADNNVQYAFYYYNQTQQQWDIDHQYISKSFKFVNQKYSNSDYLHNPFKKMYLQFEPKNGTIYFVTPCIYADDVQQTIWGDHYRFHYIWAQERIINGVAEKFSDIVGFHKTIQNPDLGKANHIYCNFKNKYQFNTDANNVINPGLFDNLQCVHLMNFNRQYIDSIFTNDIEKNMIKDLINIPFNPEMASMVGGKKSKKKSQTGGIGDNSNTLTFKPSNKFNKIHLIKITYKKEWHITVNLYIDEKFVDRFYFKSKNNIINSQLNQELKKYNKILSNQ